MSREMHEPYFPPLNSLILGNGLLDMGASLSPSLMCVLNAWLFGLLYRPTSMKANACMAF